jgi:hypothetical protein
VVSDEDRKLTKYFKFAMNRGKNQAQAPVLIHKPLHKYVDFLMDTNIRRLFNVMPSNPYLFALPGTNSKYVDGYKQQREAAQSCGAKNPKALNSRGLRRMAVTGLDV